MQEQVDAVQGRPLTWVLTRNSSEGEIVLLESIADESCI